MFEPEIFGISSSTLWTLTQALITPTLGFVFLYLVGVPLSELSFLPKGTKYKPPNWVLPLFAWGSTFVLVGLVSANFFLNYLHQRVLSDDVRSELFLVRELDAGAKTLTTAAIALAAYDGLSHFRIFANGYHAFSSDRDCVTSFQCTSKPAEAAKAANELKQHRNGGSIYELNVTNDLPRVINLNHFLAEGQNYLDLISENSGTGGCDLRFEMILAGAQNKVDRYSIEIVSHRDSHGGKPPDRQSQLAAGETFYSGGPQSGDTIERYKTSALERRNLVCERIRISFKLTKDQAQSLSSESDFASHFQSRQKAYVCETIGKKIPPCETRQ